MDGKITTIRLASLDIMGFRLRAPWYALNKHITVIVKSSPCLSSIFSRERGPRLNPLLLTTPTQTDWTFGYYNNNNSRGFLIGIPLCRETPVGFSSLPLHNNSEILLNQLEIRLYLPIKILKNKFCVCTTTAKCCQNTARLISRSIYLSSFVFRGKGN